MFTYISFPLDPELLKVRRNLILSPKPSIVETLNRDMLRELHWKVFRLWPFQGRRWLCATSAIKIKGMILKETFRLTKVWQNDHANTEKESITIKEVIGFGMSYLSTLQIINGVKALTGLEKQQSLIDKENRPLIKITACRLDFKWNYTLGYDHTWVWAWVNKWISMMTFLFKMCLLLVWNTIAPSMKMHKFRTHYQWNFKIQSGQVEKRNPAEAQSSTISLPRGIFSVCLFVVAGT